MSRTPHFVMRPDGTVSKVGDGACAITGIPLDSFVGLAFVEHLLPEHRIRWESELDAINSREESHGRVSCTAVGLDGIGRRLTLRMRRLDDDRIHVDLASELRNRHRDTRRTLIAGDQRLLPLSRRLTTLCRRAESRREIFESGLGILVEATAAISGATVEWGDLGEGWSVTATQGEFDQSSLSGLSRGAIVGRLARGDVIVKEPQFGQAPQETSIILVPLMAAQAPEGLVVLCIEGYSVLVPTDQQSLEVLGEILGLGLRALSAVGPSPDDGPRAADGEAYIALGRLSAGLAHGINNAATILRNNLERPSVAPMSQGFGRAAVEDSAARDSAEAIETIRDLTDALRAFAPEDVRGTEEVDILRTIEMVVAAVSFYAKRGTSVTVVRLPDDLPPVRCRSHYLVRSLFLVFVELWEAASATGNGLEVTVTLRESDGAVKLAMNVRADPFAMPTVLMSQLERGGVLARHVERAGAKHSHSLDGDNLAITLTLPLSASDREDDTGSVPPSARPTRRGKIVIIDDDEAVIRSIRRILDEDHDVFAASSAEVALDLLQSNRNADLILLDAFMPGMSGPQIREEIRPLGEGIADRVVFLTGGATDPEVTDYLSTSGCRVMEKPLDVDALQRLIGKSVR